MSLKRSRSPSLSDANSHPLLRRAPPNANDVPQIQKLTRDLWDVRRQLTANIARENTIISELKSLNSAFVPEASAQLRANGSSKNDDSGSFPPFFLSLEERVADA